MVLVAVPCIHSAARRGQQSSCAGPLRRKLLAITLGAVCASSPLAVTRAAFRDSEAVKSSRLQSLRPSNRSRVGSRLKGPGSQRQPLNRPPRPNVLMMIVDDLRADLGCYGRPWAKTPHMDALAARATLFTNAHAAVANCAPSRASLLTGLRPDWSGVHDLMTHVRKPRPNAVTLPQRFKEAGYLSVSYGKIYHNLLDDNASWTPPSEFMHDHTCRDVWSIGTFCQRGWRYSQFGAQKAKRRSTLQNFEHLFERGPPTPSIYTDYTIASSAMRAIDRFEQLTVRKPFFLAVGFIRPHLPFEVPSHVFDEFVGAGRVPPPPRRRAPDGTSALTFRHLSEGISELYTLSGALRNGSLQLTVRTPDDGAAAAAAAAAALHIRTKIGGRALAAERKARRSSVSVRRAGMMMVRKSLPSSSPPPPSSSAFASPASSSAERVASPTRAAARARANAALTAIASARVEASSGAVGEVGPRAQRARTELKLTQQGTLLSEAYAAAVSFVDSQVGRLVGRLDQSAFSNSTLVVLFGDHGWKLGHLGSWGKHTVMSHDTHVPFMIAVPGVSAGIVKPPVELLDVYPTLLDLAGIAKPAWLQGRTLLPVLGGKAISRAWSDSSFAFSQWPLGLDSPQPRAAPCMGYAVRGANFTLIQWVRTPINCGGHHCVGPIRGRETKAEWEHALADDKCKANFDLFQTPIGAELTPTVEPEAVSVANRYPLAVQQLRMVLARRMHLPLAAVALTVGERSLTGRPSTAVRLALKGRPLRTPKLLNHPA